MKISTEIGSTSKIVGEAKAVEYIAKAGFDAWDFSMFYINQDWHPLSKKNYLQYARELRKIGEENGIVCNQSHAPFPVSAEGMDFYLRRAIECTAEAGGKICIIHPDNHKTPEENAQMYLSLLPLAKECGVKIATENMWNWDSSKNEASKAACSDEVSFCDHLKAVNDEYMVACLDIGHAEMKGLNTSAEKMILALGDKLQALHIHDNDRWHDSHQIPGSMDIDFDKVVKALKHIKYKGYFTLEAGEYMRAYTQENIMQGLNDLKQSVRGLADKFEQ